MEGSTLSIGYLRVIDAAVVKMVGEVSPLKSPNGLMLIVPVEMRYRGRQERSTTRGLRGGPGEKTDQLYSGLLI